MGAGQSQTLELEPEIKSEAQPSSVDEIRHASSFGEVGAITRAPSDYRSSAAEDMLPSEDIINGGFQWRTRLVVLSACNSLRGQVNLLLNFSTICEPFKLICFLRNNCDHSR